MNKEGFYAVTVLITLLVFIAILVFLTFSVFYIFTSMFVQGVIIFLLYFTCGCVFTSVSEILER